MIKFEGGISFVLYFQIPLPISEENCCIWFSSPIPEHLVL